MQAKSLDVMSSRTDPVPASTVHDIADEIGSLSRTVLTDLRAMVHQLRPATSTQLGVEEALRALAASTAHRTGLDITLDLAYPLDTLEPELAEDLYRIVAEALHNVVKHAGAANVHIGVRSAAEENVLSVRISDDGGVGSDSAQPAAQDGYGVIGMRERAERWNGTLTVVLDSEAGAVVETTIPLPTVGPALG